MTAVANLLAGTRLTASEVEGIAPLSAYKGADQSVTSSTVLVNDNALFVSVLASAIYLFTCNLDYEGGTAGSSDMKWKWSVPTGATMRYTRMGYTPGAIGTAVAAMQTEANTPQAGTNGAGVLEGQFMFGTLSVSTTAGTLQLTWAQNTSSGTATIVHTGSVLALWQIQ